MKNLLTFFSLILLLSTFQIVNAQKKSKGFNELSGIYDYSEKQLNSVDTIVGFNSKPNKLKISGTVYLSDGKTPAKDVILYVYQPNEKGNYEMKRDENRKRYINNRGWVKTDENGEYTLYTFMPGKFITKELKQIHRVVKEPGKPEYELSSFFFNDDPLLPYLTLACRAQAVKSMLRLEEKNGMLVANRDIRLNSKSSLIQ